MRHEPSTGSDTCGRVVPRPAVVPWLTFWAGFAVLDYWADRRGMSLSHATRHLFRTQHPAGRTLFAVALGLGYATLHRHILKVETETSARRTA